MPSARFHSMWGGVHGRSTSCSQYLGYSERQKWEPLSTSFSQRADQWGVVRGPADVGCRGLGAQASDLDDVWCLQLDFEKKWKSSGGAVLVMSWTLQDPENVMGKHRAGEAAIRARPRQVPEHFGHPLTFLLHLLLILV